MIRFLSRGVRLEQLPLPRPMRDSPRPSSVRLSPHHLRWSFVTPQTIHHGPRIRLFHASTCWSERHRKKNPHAVLGVSAQATVAEIKRSFIQLALEHHPDRASGSSSPDRFIQIRQAFEELIQRSNNNHNGSSNDAPSGWSSEELQDWWSHQDESVTKDFLTFEISETTRQEVIRVYRTMSAGGKDKGGYWEMARQLSEREAAAGANVQEREPTRLLAASDTPGVTRRPRRRNR